LGPLIIDILAAPFYRFVLSKRYRVWKTSGIEFDTSDLREKAHQFLSIWEKKISNTPAPTLFVPAFFYMACVSRVLLLSL